MYTEKDVSKKTDCYPQKTRPQHVPTNGITYDTN